MVRISKIEGVDYIECHIDEATIIEYIGSNSILFILKIVIPFKDLNLTTAKYWYLKVLHSSHSMYRPGDGYKLYVNETYFDRSDIVFKPMKPLSIVPPSLEEIKQQCVW